jgi:hypothetical protein
MGKKDIHISYVDDWMDTYVLNELINSYTLSAMIEVPFRILNFYDENNNSYNYKDMIKVYIKYLLIIKQFYNYFDYFRLFFSSTAY